MKKWEKTPEEINGFKILKDFGLQGKGKRFGIVVCKECQKEFETSLYTLHIIKSCGCIKYSQIKPLPEMINGFRIIKDLGYNGKARRAIVECKVCKREYEAHPHYLKERKHCGCFKKGSIVSRYNKTYPRLGQAYKHMISRCYKKNDKDYYNYGARGITVCEEWKNDRNKFCEWALNNGYTDELSIDRIDSSKGYYPENCRWVSAKIQAQNTRRNVMNIDLAKKIRMERSAMTTKQLADKYNVSEGTIWNIINNKSWIE